MAKADGGAIKKKVGEKQTTTLDTSFKKASEVKAEQQQKPKPAVANSLAELVKSAERWVMYKKRLPYKSWALYVFKRDSRYTIRVVSLRQKKITVKLSITLNDAKYIRELIGEIEETFKKYGLYPIPL